MCNRLPLSGRAKVCLPAGLIPPRPVPDAKGKRLWSRGERESSELWGLPASHQELLERFPYPFRLLDGDNNIYYYGRSGTCDDEAAFVPLERAKVDSGLHDRDGWAGQSKSVTSS